jgi:hypothetical protein
MAVTSQEANGCCRVIRHTLKALSPHSPTLPLWRTLISPGALVARELGLGELSAMSDEVRNQVEDEAEQYLEQWAEIVEMKTSPAIRPMRG